MAKARGRTSLKRYLPETARPPLPDLMGSGDLAFRRHSAAQHLDCVGELKIGNLAPRRRPGNIALPRPHGFFRREMVGKIGLAGTFDLYEIRALVPFRHSEIGDNPGRLD